jgi:hypothetical protein
MKMANRKAVYFINELCRDKDGGYIPCIAVEGETGYHPTDWNWGNDLALANQIADEKNAALGFSPMEAALIQIGTMMRV